MSHFEKMCEISINNFDDEEDPTHPWVITVKFVNAGVTEDIPGFKTPGQALDYAYKWASDRGMFIGTPDYYAVAKREVQ